uniref:Histidine--tRNA ligase, chloroplastic n=1 Tax=Dasya naccarioides TaxID=2007180 RepID=A0A1Z1MGZ7_9FLOR|nr:Histidine-tRNA ligase [Dasya naccarioides]ARW65273.1 Histidine-tRNA ligase [Dasya naccarioides]
METLRGVKDILPGEIEKWQQLYDIAYDILSKANYIEIRTPVLENTELFKRSIGNFTDIVNKEMYSFEDQGNRNVTLRPEGTASVARAFISNKMYINNNIHRLWYLGPMFRYERPQKGRQRQFHQLGIECIGSNSPIADIEVIRLALKILNQLNIKGYKLEINSIGSLEERTEYQEKLVNYLTKYEDDLDIDSKKRLKTNPIRILDSKIQRTQKILLGAPKLKDVLKTESLNHFNYICESLNYLNIPYEINNNLVRGLDYYNYTAFEIKINQLGSQNTLCGGGRYDKLIEQIGGPSTPSVGWAIGIERLIIIIKNLLNDKIEKPEIYLITEGKLAKQKVWHIIEIIEECQICFELDLNEKNLKKQVKKASNSNAKICCILGEDEIKNNHITVKWLKTGQQEQVILYQFKAYLKYIKNSVFN